MAFSGPRLLGSGLQPPLPHSLSLALGSDPNKESVTCLSHPHHLTLLISW